MLSKDDNVKERQFSTQRSVIKAIHGLVVNCSRLKILTVKSKLLSDSMDAFINEMDNDTLCCKVYECQGYMDQHLVKRSLHCARLSKITTNAKSQVIFDAAGVGAAESRGQLIWRNSMAPPGPGPDITFMSLQNALDNLTLRLETRRAKLLYQLQLMYPIAIPTKGSLAPTQSYSIRDIHLAAADPYALVDDDTVSCALGYCCHLVLMVAKYMAIPLRYRIIYRCSRSLISNEISPMQGLTDYPLYIKGVERAKFDCGVILLNRLVEQILRRRCIESCSSQIRLENPIRILNNLALLFRIELP
uniref:Uncharacterized protein n=1 Tax=Spongospora subterranea TaxID=70186 RepID=A0A0H5RIW6_9EUKA|eukprot:CRZ08639.1 hypothetical protein [Spongospora subterranea]